MSKIIQRKYQYTVDGVTVGTREKARSIQRAMRAADPKLIDETKIVQRILMERVVR